MGICGIMRPALGRFTLGSFPRLAGELQPRIRTAFHGPIEQCSARKILYCKTAGTELANDGTNLQAISGRLRGSIGSKSPRLLFARELRAIPGSNRQFGRVPRAR